MTALRPTTPDGPEPTAWVPDATDGRDDGALLECRVAFAGDTARVLPVGEIDFDSVALVADRLEGVRAAGAADVVLDLRETTFMDSSGLHLALAWQERARRERFGFALTRGSAAVRRTIDAAGLRSTLTFVSEAP